MSLWIQRMWIKCVSTITSWTKKLWWPIKFGLVSRTPPPLGPLSHPLVPSPSAAPTPSLPSPLFLLYFHGPYSSIHLPYSPSPLPIDSPEIVSSIEVAWPESRSRNDPLRIQRGGRLGRWVESLSNVASSKEAVWHLPQEERSRGMRWVTRLL